MRDLWYHSRAFVYIFIAFIARFCSLANSGQPSYVGLILVGLPTQCTTHLSLKIIMFDHTWVNYHLDNTLIHKK